MLVITIACEMMSSRKGFLTVRKISRASFFGVFFYFFIFFFFIFYFLFFFYFFSFVLEKKLSTFIRGNILVVQFATDLRKKEDENTDRSKLRTFQ